MLLLFNKITPLLKKWIYQYKLNRRYFLNILLVSKL